MVYLSTSDEWQRQSALLLKARPTTARVTTKYNVPNLDSHKYQTKSKKRKRDGEGDVAMADSAAAAAPRVPRATLVLKTYCPESGVCLKFKTDRAAEVGRLVAGLGRLGRHMAALPEKAEVAQPTSEKAAIADDAVAVHSEKTSQPPPPQPPQQQQQQSSTSGKKKKKGKK